ncbi:choice-of-anchor I family protein [Parendozoicomonas sp. Alg238-R29]|uniref:choice-of-anchor I family protein n=1 Tax=Parendozoicomonas sp. Alg238-R29 TaxID=2993446 RepID=UPI00248E22BD|nr:choice-of-anchor I family protein [Parendozoicomonas sp. Alg238-R29]
MKQPLGKKLVTGSALTLTLLVAGCSAHQKVTEKSSPADLKPIGRYVSGQYHKGAAEIVAWHASSQSVFVVNSASGTVDILDASGLQSLPLANSLHDSNMSRKNSLDLQKDIPFVKLGAANSVSVKGNLLAVAVENANKQASGVVAFYKLDEKGNTRFSDYVTVGSLPDMVTFTPDGRFALVANEGEPSPDYKNDPEGSVSIISIVEDKATAVRTAGFTDFNVGGSRASELSSDVRIFGRNASVAQDLEPEYITVSSDSRKAWVSLQENNALAIVDIEEARIEAIKPLGFKDYGKSPIDASNKDKAVNIQPWSGVYGMYQPDTITSFDRNGKTFIVSANEGDARDYWYKVSGESECLATGGLKFDDEDGCLGFTEEKRVGKLTISETHPHVEDAADKKKLGRLKVTVTMGDLNGNGDYEELYSYGARSFSIWDESGNLVFDSGSDFERITSELLGDNFNNNDEKTKGDSRSDDKGPEPEAVAVGEVDGTTYAFIGLERTGGIFMYDISNPSQPEYVRYINNRDFNIDAKKDTANAGDLSPEGMAFVDASESPTGRALLIVGHEVSGTTTVYEVD